MTIILCLSYCGLLGLLCTLSLLFVAQELLDV